MEQPSSQGRTVGRRGSYCLVCYGALAPDPMGSRGGPSRVCTHCGAVNLRADQRLFWTKEPWLVHLEGWAKAGVLVVLGGIAWAMSARSPGGGSGQGWILGFPIVAGAVLWQSVEKITRWKPYFRARTFWTLVPLALAVFALGLALLDLAGGSTPNPEGTLVVGAFVALNLAWAWGARGLCGFLERWRDRRIASGPRGAGRE